MSLPSVSCSPLEAFCGCFGEDTDLTLFKLQKSALVGGTSETFVYKYLRKYTSMT